MVRFASCESDCPVLLVATGLLRQYIHVLLSNRGDPSPRPFGHFPVTPAMLGTANGAVSCTNPSIHGLRWCGLQGKRIRLWLPLLLRLLRQEAAELGPHEARRMRGGRARCAPVRCMYTDVHSANPGAQSRTRRAGCPEGAPPGVCFFAYFLCTSKESKPLARRASGSSALRSKKEQRRWIPAWAGMTSERVRRKASGRSALRCARETALDSRFRGNDGIKLRCACCVALGQKGERSAPVVVIRKPPATASRDR